MTGPEHYRAAEEDLAAMNSQSKDGVAVLLARAQVHATLALAAATALRSSAGVIDYGPWKDATGAVPS